MNVSALITLTSREGSTEPLSCWNPSLACELQHAVTFGVYIQYFYLTEKADNVLASALFFLLISVNFLFAFPFLS